MQPFALAAFVAETTTAFGSVVVVVAVSLADTGPAKEMIKPETRVATSAYFFERFIFTPNKYVKCAMHLM